MRDFTGHTPGPWRIEARRFPGGKIGPQIDLISADDTTIAENLYARDGNLIAAAPDLAADNARLREALEEIRDALGTVCYLSELRRIQDRARAALNGK